MDTKLHSYLGKKLISSHYIFIKYTNCSSGKKITAVEKYSIMQLNLSNTAQTIHSKNMWKHAYKNDRETGGSDAMIQTPVQPFPA